VESVHNGISCFKLIEVMFVLLTCHEHTEEINLALEGGGWLTPLRGRFTHKNDRVHIV